MDTTEPTTTTTTTTTATATATRTVSALGRDGRWYTGPAGGTLYRQDSPIPSGVVVVARVSRTSEWEDDGSARLATPNRRRARVPGVAETLEHRRGGRMRWDGPGWARWARALSRGDVPRVGRQLLACLPAPHGRLP